jgi:hypothetical protein
MGKRRIASSSEGGLAMKIGVFWIPIFIGMGEIGARSEDKRMPGFSQPVGTD